MSSTSKKQTEQAQEQVQKKVPYTISRGDGSSGGGGLPMPKQFNDDDGLVRPKVCSKKLYSLFMYMFVNYFETHYCVTKQTHGQNQINHTF